MNVIPKQSAFPTLGAAVLYLNGFHHGKHLDRLNYLSRHKPDWVMRVANNMWNTRNDEVVGEKSTLDFYADVLDWAIPDVFTRVLNGDA